MVVSCFQRLGMALPIDGSQDHILSVKGLKALQVGDWTKEPASIETVLSKRSGVVGGKKKKKLEAAVSTPAPEDENNELDSTGDDNQAISYVRK